MNSASIAKLRVPSPHDERDDDETPPPSLLDTSKSSEAVSHTCSYSFGGMESSDNSPSRYAAQNPSFDVGSQPIEAQFDQIEKEFALLEARTMNPRQYTFTTSNTFPTKNRYINVMANEETIFPPPRTALATRSCAPAASPRTTGQRLLDTFRGASVSSAASDNDNSGGGSGGDVAGFKASGATAGGKNVPLYFNANVVDMGVEPVFVASQAPVPDCMEDFFNAIYNASISLVLMLTETEEAGFLKADRYWPADKAPGIAGETFGNMCVYKDLDDPYTVDAAHELIRRPFFIRPCNAAKSREHKVVMVQYVGWPDRGVPDSTESFEELLRIVRAHADSTTASQTAEHQRTSSASSSASHSSGGGVGGSVKAMPPVLVHCSAGIGRTGTLIGAYAAVRMMEQGRLQRGSVAKLVADMRRARFGMVQRVEQYMFLYLIVLRHLGVDTAGFAARMQQRADLFNYRWMEARQAAMAARGARQQQQ